MRWPWPGPLALVQRGEDALHAPHARAEVADAAGRPRSGGPSGSPVTCMMPPMPWAIRSNPPFSRYGPSEPKPESWA